MVHRTLLCCWLVSNVSERELRLEEKLILKCSSINVRTTAAFDDSASVLSLEVILVWAIIFTNPNWKGWDTDTVQVKDYTTVISIARSRSRN